MRPSREDEVGRRELDRLAHDRAVADGDAALAFERFLAARDLQRAGEIAGDRDVREVEERGDVGDREVRRGDVEIEARRCLRPAAS